MEELVQVWVVGDNALRPNISKSRFNVALFKSALRYQARVVEGELYFHGHSLDVLKLLWVFTAKVSRRQLRPRVPGAERNPTVRNGQMGKLLDGAQATWCLAPTDEIVAALVEVRLWGDQDSRDPTIERFDWTR